MQRCATCPVVAAKGRSYSTHLDKVPHHQDVTPFPRRDTVASGPPHHIGSTMRWELLAAAVQGPTDRKKSKIGSKRDSVGMSYPGHRIPPGCLDHQSRTGTRREGGHVFSTRSNNVGACAGQGPHRRRGGLWIDRLYRRGGSRGVGVCCLTGPVVVLVFRRIVKDWEESAKRAT